MYRVIVSLVLMMGTALAQNGSPSPAEQKPAPPPAQKASAPEGSAAPKTIPLSVSRAQRLGAAKTAFIKKVEGSEIPVNVIRDSLEGWGRYTMAGSADKADLVIEISSPDEQPSSVTINGSRNPITGYPEQMTTRNISNNPIKMTVYDAKTRLPLWSAMEQPKRALKQKSREDNLVEAAQTLFSRFHEAVEPSAP